MAAVWQQQAFAIDARYNAHRAPNHPNFSMYYDIILEIFCCPKTIFFYFIGNKLVMSQRFVGLQVVFLC